MTTTSIAPNLGTTIEPIVVSVFLRLEYHAEEKTGILDERPFRMGLFEK